VTKFYRQLRDRTVSKAEALRQAQLALMQDKRYGHPVYWSPYLPIGNWL
jgi:CHAT domain-containing protein